jgi:hypothetical protein
MSCIATEPEIRVMGKRTKDEKYLTCQVQHDRKHRPEYGPHDCGNHPIWPADKETSYKNHSDTEQQG